MLMVGCSYDGTVNARFDGPELAVAIAPESSPFVNPIGLVAGRRDGVITPIDLGRGWLLSDDLASPFLAADPIPMGSGRIPSAMVAESSAEHVTLWVGDAVSGELLEVPWIVGSLDGDPIEIEAELSTDVLFEDVDASGDSATLSRLMAHTGAATTESWSVVFDGSEWVVTGSASGLQQERAHVGLPYRSDRGEVSFTVIGDATAGDTLSFGVETGLVSHEVGGQPTGLALLGDSGLLAMTIWDGEASSLQLFDTAAGELLGEVALPAGASPWGLLWDEVGESLLVSDLGIGGLHSVAIDSGDPLASGTTHNLAGLEIGHFEVIRGEGYEHLFVAPVAANSVELYDLATFEQLDINPITPEVDGLRLDSPVVGLEASVVEATLPERTSWGANYSDMTVAIATMGGEMWLAEGATGCFVEDEGGPYAYIDSTEEFGDEGASSNPDFDNDGGLVDSVVVGSCGGVVRDEVWAATFDEVVGAWLVEGAYSGRQEGVAWEDVRYVSDNGAISFTILSGDRPSTHGDRFKWHTVAGLAVTGGDVDQDGYTDLNLEYPAAPVAYSWMEPADSDEGFEVGSPRAGLMWPIVNADAVLLVDAGNAKAAVLID